MMLNPPVRYNTKTTMAMIPNLLNMVLVTADATTFPAIVVHS